MTSALPLPPSASRGTTAHLHAIGTAHPPHDVHAAFLAWAGGRVNARARPVFERMAARAGIARRWSVLAPLAGAAATAAPGAFYAGDAPPGTARRMALYAEAAPELALRAVADLRDKVELHGITHLVVASCTGFVAPGLDQIVARRLGLAPTVERLLIGFMGCYAAVVALRSARHIVRSDPQARVLVICCELSSLHLQDTDDLESLLAMLQFGDGAAAALVSAEPGGFALGQPFAATLPDSDSLIRWTITDQGFAMHLSGEVPRRIAQALGDADFRAVVTQGQAPSAIDGWAVHAGGRSILDAVETSLSLPPDALASARGVLHDHGNMSSATLMFTLARMLEGSPIRQGVALAFGPGLAAEGLGFRSAS
ncbi:type III polyketide synthase [Sphingomonas abaci]|uniref:Putative naringenin-chalcone synthase n=1 Tax=Sphingomonas abaci TaxID=237611 RepID=A0A7W7AJP4_9SPHN|nr:type III polyketide synthase [Sphingomonas abaci]MBB4618313.1 putative naringenin-chalcone synthase [Sphingomonas abaci]